jgi:hypothetical protein
VVSLGSVLQILLQVLLGASHVFEEIGLEDGAVEDRVGAGGAAARVPAR